MNSESGKTRTSPGQPQRIDRPKLRRWEADETLRAIQQGAVDAFVMGKSGEQRVYTLEGTDRPYRMFVEQMLQAVATLHPDGTIVYANGRLADLLLTPLEKLAGSSLLDHIPAP